MGKAEELGICLIGCSQRTSGVNELQIFNFSFSRFLSSCLLLHFAISFCLYFLPIKGYIVLPSIPLSAHPLLGFTHGNSVLSCPLQPHFSTSLCCLLKKNPEKLWMKKKGCVKVCVRVAINCSTHCYAQ